MNIAIIDIKGFLKNVMRIIIVISLIIILISSFKRIYENIKLPDKLLTSILEVNNSLFSYKEDKESVKYENISNKILALELSALEHTNILEEDQINTSNEDVLDNQIEIQKRIEIPKTSQTEAVNENNIAESSTDLYESVKIKNKSDYELTEDILKPDIEINNKKDILIFHTHTCESYTSSEQYSYTMTGNYRTTDNNYNMVRVGAELKTHLEKKGFNVTHDTTCHDYPAYNGSYDRSLETVESLLYDKTTEIVIDLHRDAVGNGDTYGPTVKINGQKVAQLMFVIGTDGGGLEHPNWQENLKIAIKIQAKANEMYPGLFRPIILTNSRYNQHTARGACIIEVGATANKLEECLLSMQCLANVLEEI